MDAGKLKKGSEKMNM